jgi:MFS family permease
MNEEAAREPILTDIPARLDRLPWSGWHWRVVIALGVTWVLDGLEVTIVGSVAGVLGEPGTLNLSEARIGAAASAYLAGAVVGALVFGRLTDQYGRKKLFLVTLAIYLVATLLTAASWNFASFAFFRALTGAGIGGEASAMNSAIDELIPARVRGRVDLAVNGSYWLGTAIGAAASLVLLNPRVLPHDLGWRACFGLGAALGISVLLVRRHLPESPRWLLLHHRAGDAERITREIEATVAGGREAAASPERLALVQVHGAASPGRLLRVLFGTHRRRSLLCLAMMVSQAFTYNAIFFTYALVLHRFYGVPSDRVGLYIIPFAVGNLLGPLVLGPLFDTVGRRVMIFATYAGSGCLLAGTGYAFARGWLTAESQTALWCLVFFLASAAASSAYLSVSELFPVEMRGFAIAIFYSVGIAVGGIAGPAIFGELIRSGDRELLFYGYLAGAALMWGAALAAAWLGVNSERLSLEELAIPATASRP